ncbi:MAG: hypothetical protein IPK80_21485 [Nannocystis sp.]|nr:hypothetical protein [Nannocystis sp.]
MRVTVRTSAAAAPPDHIDSATPAPTAHQPPPRERALTFARASTLARAAA